jgi:hypothetical protein
MYWYADTVGATLDWRSKFSVSTVCGNSLSHRFIGKFSATPARIALKWLLKVWIALSARFLRRLSGGTSWSSQFSFILALNVADALLFRRCVHGLTVPEGVIRAHNAW